MRTFFQGCPIDSFSPHLHRLLPFGSAIMHRKRIPGHIISFEAYTKLAFSSVTCTVGRSTAAILENLLGSLHRSMCTTTSMPPPTLPSWSQVRDQQPPSLHDRKLECWVGRTGLAYFDKCQKSSLAGQNGWFKECSRYGQ